ncbi:MAG: hypothetical protein AAB661_01290 [Patescibacteria group bacterium]
MIKRIKKNRGFVILFAVTLSGILLSIALGVANIAQKEIRFGTSAQDTNNAFFAADTGAECALFNDKSASNSFVQTGGTGTVSCFGGSIPLSGNYPFWSFVVSGLGNGGQGCAEVTVDKSVLPTTTVISKGYNNGGGTGSCVQGTNSVERELELNY